MVRNRDVPIQIGPYEDSDLEFVCGLAAPRGDRAVAFTVKTDGAVCSTGRYGLKRGFCGDLRLESDLLDELADLFLGMRPEGGRILFLGHDRREIRLARGRQLFAIVLDA